MVGGLGFIILWYNYVCRFVFCCISIINIIFKANFDNFEHVIFHHWTDLADLVADLVIIFADLRFVTCVTC